MICKFLDWPVTLKAIVTVHMHRLLEHTRQFGKWWVGIVLVDLGG